MSRGPRALRFPALGPHGFHRLAYKEWGDADNPRVVVCMHGLTRNARDFDDLAEALCGDFRVVCPDVVGRGDSDWLERKEEYGFPLYVSDAAALVARIVSGDGARGGSLFGGRPRAASLDWVGTSMGGIVGMMLAGKTGSPIRRLVLNDVGATVPWTALLNLSKAHSGHPGRFDSLAAVEAHLRVACAEFGPLDDARWRRVAQHSAWRRRDGSYALNYDPAILGAGLAAGPPTHGEGLSFGADILFGFDLWRVWSRVRARTLVLRGGDSDLLPAAVLERMIATRPQTQAVVFAGIGHAPWLMTPDQIAPVKDFLGA